MTELPQKRQARIERMEKQKGQRATTSAYGSLPWRRPRRAGKFHRLMAGMGTGGGRNSTRTGKTGARPGAQTHGWPNVREDKLTPAREDYPFWNWSLASRA